MKKILNMLLAAGMLAACSYKAQAQKGEVKFDFSYNYSLPVGNFKNNIISNGSPIGASGAIMYSFNNVLSLGGSLGFQGYYQKYPRALYQTGKYETTSAVLSNSIGSVPLLAKIAYSPLGNTAAPVQPYISGAAGISFIGFQQYLGEFGSSDNSVSFQAQAGAGVFVPFGKLSGSGLRLGATYNYLPYNRYGLGNLNTVDFQAGVYFPLR